MPLKYLNMDEALCYDTIFHRLCPLTLTPTAVCLHGNEPCTHRRWKSPPQMVWKRKHASLTPHCTTPTPPPPHTFLSWWFACFVWVYTFCLVLQDNQGILFCTSKYFFIVFFTRYDNNQCLTKSHGYLVALWIFRRVCGLQMYWKVCNWFKLLNKLTMFKQSLMALSYSIDYCSERSLRYHNVEQST